jgi:hypothetical protein
MTIQDLEQYRGKNYVLHVKTQKEWDSVIPIFRKNRDVRFKRQDFNSYEKMVIYLDHLNTEFYGDLRNVNLKRYTVISLSNSIIEVW